MVDECWGTVVGLAVWLVELQDKNRQKLDYISVIRLVDKVG